MKMRRTIGLSFALLVVSAPAMAKEDQAAQQNAPSSVKSKAAGGPAVIDKSHPGRRATATRAKSTDARRLRKEAAAHAEPDRLVGPYRAIGQAVVGRAAWYGGHHIGRRTASGERLDAVHPTAAHRSLPLHSLVRVTNLSNGRSVIATINDRGPVSRKLLIDLSPSCAEELDMVHSGVASVTIEPVAPVAAAVSAPAQ